MFIIFTNNYFMFKRNAGRYFYVSTITARANQVELTKKQFLAMADQLAAEAKKIRGEIKREQIISEFSPNHHAADLSRCIVCGEPGEKRDLKRDETATLCGQCFIQAKRGLIL